MLGRPLITKIISTLPCNPRNTKAITSSNNLLSEQPNDIIAKTDESKLERAKKLFDQWNTTFDFENTGGMTMFVLDVPPEVPPQETPVMVVESYVEGDKHRTIGQCRVAENLTHRSKEDLSNSISPVFSTGLYFKWFEDIEVGFYEGKVTLLQAPQHGILEVKGKNSWTYIPDKVDYLGTDSATFMVEIDGYTVELTYGIKAVDFIGSGVQGATIHEYPENCPNGEFWKVSPDGHITPLIREVEEEDRGSLENLFQETLATDQFNLSFDDLANGALGEATNNTITLDDNANGYGWYIDLTPGLG